MSAKTDDLFKQVQAAFPTRPINGEHAFAQWGTTYPDAEPYSQQIDGKSWDQLDRAYIVRKSDALGFLSTRELVDVLPVYLRSLLEDGGWSPAAGLPYSDSGKASSRGGPRLGVDRFNALTDMLTIAQRAVVGRVLIAFGETDPDGWLGKGALSAVDNHWKQFLKTTD